MMRSPGINGEGELRGQPANPGSPGKWPLKWSVCVCLTPAIWKHSLFVGLSLTWSDPWKIISWLKGLGSSCGVTASGNNVNQSINQSVYCKMVAKWLNS